MSQDDGARAGTDVIRVKEFQSATFEHGSGSPAQAYRADAHPRDVTAVLFTTQLCFFPPSKDVIPFLSVQLKYTDGPPGSHSVKVHAQSSLTCSGLPNEGLCVQRYESITYSNLSPNTWTDKLSIYVL